jgi:hypothetical protein
MIEILVIKRTATIIHGQGWKCNSFDSLKFAKITHFTATKKAVFSKLRALFPEVQSKGEGAAPGTAAFTPGKEELTGRVSWKLHSCLCS